MDRDQLLRLDDTSLLGQCTVKTYIGSGPGGQHRNKTQSGVRLTLREWNLEIHSCEDRSAHINKIHAIHRMRLAIALQIRQVPAETIPFPFPGSQGHIQSSNALYPAFVADVLDRLVATKGSHKAVAQAWDLSPTRLLKFIQADKEFLQQAQKIRKAAGSGVWISEREEL